MEKKENTNSINENEMPKKNGQESPVSNEKEKIITRYLKIARIFMIIISVVTFLQFLEMATDAYGIDTSDVEYVIWYCVLWAITILMFVFKKKLPYLVALVVDYVKEFIRKRKESKEK